jgi:hypothetical protein
MKMKCVNVMSFHTVSQDYMCKQLQRFFFIATSQHVDFTNKHLCAYTLCQCVVICCLSDGCTEVISVFGLRVDPDGSFVCQVNEFVLITPLSISPDFSACLLQLILPLLFCSETKLVQVSDSVTNHTRLFC